MNQALKKAYPIGFSQSPEMLSKDPYSLFERLQQEEPITWIGALKMYYVVRYNDVEAILKDDKNFVIGTPGSVIFDTFGEHMLTVEGERHDFYKQTFRGSFMPKHIRDNIEGEILQLVNRLIDDIEAGGQGRAELRSQFASRLPVQVMLYLFGLPPEDEEKLRLWYSSFEQALENFTWDEAVREKAHKHVAEFHAHLQLAIDRVRIQPDQSLLNSLVNTPEDHSLSDEEIKRNASIIFFGGISTVEALILNAFYALSIHPNTFERVRKDPALIPQMLEEVVRWMSPVQSATRHVVRDYEFKGVKFKKGDTVNCMLSAANRDPEVFLEPEVFDIDRKNNRHHLGFATGPHNCLGSHLARAEARIAIDCLLKRLSGCCMDPENPSEPEGYEFRQPKELNTIWNI